MAKIKVENSFIWVILAAIRIYSTNFLKLCSYMLFPVLGQVLGLLLVFCLAGVFSAYWPELADKYEMFNDMAVVMISVVLLTIPGLLIFTKAFWEYLLVYGAMNSVTECFLTTGKIYDYPAHKATVTKKAFNFIALWILYSIFISLGLIPFLWIPAAIFFVYFILIFQVFSFEQGNPVDYFTRSFDLIKGNLIRTLLIMCIIVFFTHFIFVLGVSVIFDVTHLTQFLGSLFENTIIEFIPIDEINDFMLMVNPSFDLLTAAKISAFFIYQVVAFVVIGFTLPLRSITWALWYKALREKELKKEAKPVKKKAVKRVSQEIIDRANRKFQD
ncbi:hypothetical protein IKP85_07110 [bacterium]|nr:hypothetical protein [bacterium]